MRYDYIINCIMAPVDVGCMTDVERKRQFLINSHFPLWLSNAVSVGKSVKVINISSDAVFSGKRACGSYDEFSFPDPNCLYGLSKFLGESSHDNVLNIRSSFLGSDPRAGRGLIELVLRSEENCKLVGYTDYMWSGVTTKQFGVLINHIIEEDLFCGLKNFSHVLNYSCNKPISKYGIILMIKQISGREDIILSPQSNPSGPINRSIISSCGLLSILNARQSTLSDSLKEILNERY
jgi:dTDP-4-dehydrorhamnose reductase